MIKKISALVLALALSITTFTACSKDKDKNDSSNTSSVSANDSGSDSAAEVPVASFTIDGKEVDTKDLILCTIDGTDIDFDTFRYYYFYTINLYTQNYGATLDTISQTEGGFDLLMQDVITQLKQENVALRLAKENGIELDEDDQKYVDETIASAKANYESDEEFKTSLQSAYLTEDLYRKMIETSRIYEKVEDQLFTNGGKYATSKDDFKKIVKDEKEYAAVKHILIPYECTAEITDEETKEGYDELTLSEKSTAKKTAFNALSEEDQKKAKEDAKKLAEEVLAKAKDGDDFDKLIKEYGWDPGMETYTDGYYINQNTSFVDEFKTAAFKLKENGISDLVENSSYGWFIIKRLPIDMDYVDKNIDSMIIEYDTPTINQLYTDTMKEMNVEYNDYYEKITAESIT